MTIERTHARNRPTRLTPRAFAMIGALMLAGVMAVGAANPAGASTPTGSAPNWGHWDSDYVNAATSGAAVTGWVHWDSSRQGHGSFKLNDTLRTNGRTAVLEYRYKVRGQDPVARWQLRTTTITPTYYFNLPYNSAGYEWVEFRVAQTGASNWTWAYDTNSPGGE